MRAEAELNGIIAYTFQNEQLLKTALTHSSSHATQNYERLEFLGDAVLELCTSEYLYRHFPESQEGSLTRLRAQIVCETSLASWARRRKLGAYLILGKSEEMSGGREKNSILCDVVEAIIGAVYLDGGFPQAREMVMALVEENLSLILRESVSGDAKSELQILLQKNGNVRLEYETYRQEGPPHAAIFYVHVKLNGKVLASGEGKSKKQAEQAAAAKALAGLQKKRD